MGVAELELYNESRDIEPQSGASIQRLLSLPKHTQPMALRPFDRIRDRHFYSRIPTYPSLTRGFFSLPFDLSNGDFGRVFITSSIAPSVD